jgi:predicted negative regulator of RcsB-dependent stress response
MNNYSSDEEKLISWFQENYKNILLGIILGLGIGFSYNYYNDTQSNTQFEISLKYEQAITAYNNNAKIYYINGNLEKSKNKLRQIIDNQNDKDLKSIATIRLARLLISEGKYNDAEIMIKKHGNHNTNLLSIELLGDISLAKNQLAQAKSYYMKLLNEDLPPNKIKIIKNKISLINEQ